MHTKTASLLGACAIALTLSACAGQPDTSGPVEPSGSAAGAELEGTWSVTWTADELYERFGGADNPEARDLAEGNQGEQHLVFDGDGAYDHRYLSDGSSCPGTYELDGDRIVMTATIDPARWDCGDGVGQLAADARWAVDGETLMLTEWELSAEPAMDWAVAAMLGDVPLARVQ